MPDILVQVSRVGDAEHPTYKTSLNFPGRSGDTRTAEPYLALSYCWGGDQKYKTTKERISSGNLDLDWTKIPRSIQDALVVTVSLGYKFLWVDSLCIVQDDEITEKAKQIAIMSKIYTNATLTIMASKAKSSNEGFLGDMTSSAQILPGAQPLAKLLFRESGSGREGTLYTYTAPWNNRDNDKEDPIDTRGWTFQERHLSTRILEYRSKHVRWVCRSCVDMDITDIKKNDSLTDGLRYNTSWAEHFLLHRSAKFMKAFSVHAAGEFGIDERLKPEAVDEILDGFYDLVEEYSRRVLSLPQDRILAISGIAELVRSRTDQKYAAGLWRRMLPVALIWNREYKYEEPPEPRTTDYQGPSWSWTAVNGSISFDNSRTIVNKKGFQVEISDMQVSIDLVEESAVCGAVRSGRITGLGRIRKGEWSQSDLESPRVSLRVIPEAQEDIPFQSLDMVADREADSSEGPEEVYLLELCSSETRFGFRDPYGLVLRALDAHSAHGELGAGQYSRVGVFYPDKRFDTVEEIFERCEPQRFEII